MIKISPIIATDNVNTDTVNRDLLSNISKVLKVGQILNATTELGGEVSAKVLLRVGPHLFETRTPVALENGQAVKLLVKMSGDIRAGRMPLLKILSPAIPTGAAASVTNNSPVEQSKAIAATKLRQFISVQQSFSQLQTQAHALLTDKASIEQLPESLKSWLNKVQDNLILSSNGINATQLKQKILNSGIFFESKLSRQAGQLTPDRQPYHQGTKNILQSQLSNDLKYQLLTIKSELAQFNNENASTKVSLQSSPQALTPQILTPQLFKQLQSEIRNIGNNPLELTDKLLTLLPKTDIIKIISLLTSPQKQILETDGVQMLAQLLTKVTQQPAHLRHKQASLIEQLQFRLMLLDLGQQVEQSINKLTSLQLQPLSREEDKLILLIFNLVFKDNDQHFDVNFRIQQQDQNTENDQQSWKITLSFDFKTLGSVQSKIFLTDDNISTVFYAEHSSTADKIRQLLPLLETGLAAAGLHVNNIAVTTGNVEDKPYVNRGVSLLNEIA